MAAILHVIDTTGPGGAETVFIELADRMRARGHRSVALIRGPGWVADELARRSIDVEVFDAKGSFNLPLLWRMVTLIRRYRIDLVQSHLLGSNIYAGLAGMVSRRPVVATFHGAVDVAPDERFRKLKLLALHHGVSRFVAVSDALADTIDARGLLRRDRCQVIYNGVDLARYRPGTAADRSGFRRANAIPEGARVLGCVGNLRTAKAYDVLLEAFTQLSASVPQLHVAIAGQGSAAARDALLAQARAAGVHDRLHLLGFCADVPTFLRGIDVFVLPSRSEGFSIATVEALATGLPIVATRCGGPEEILTHGVDGWLVEKENPTQLAAAVGRVLAADQPLAGLQATALAAAAGRYSLDAMVDNYDALYRALSGGAPP